MSPTPTAAVACPPRLDLLHGFSAHVDHRVLELPQASQRLIAFLALQSHPRHRLFVAGSLWADSSEQRAAASLRSSLWRLGKAGAAFVTARGTMLALADEVQFDLRAAVLRARQVIDCPHEQGATALDLGDLGGDLLPDWYDDWVLLERERFRHLRLRALEALCRARAEQGRFAEATEAGLAAVAGDPLRESAHRALICAHLSEGNQSEALRQYRLCERLFEQRLGMAPSALIEGLVAHLLRRGP